VRCRSVQFTLGVYPRKHLGESQVVEPSKIQDIIYAK
jgi:hypothetical protein